MTDAIRRVETVLAEAGFPAAVVELDHSARTAYDAAAALECTVAQIAKSLIVLGTVSGRLALVLIRGGDHLDLDRLSTALGEPAEMAPAATVKRTTGFAVGGVPPVGHLTPLPAWMDRRLWEEDPVWAAAGHPRAVFRTTGPTLAQLTQAQVLV